MKKINIAILILLSILTLSCRKDDISEINIDLEQTQWKGKYIRTENGITEEFDIQITFETENTGHYRIPHINSQNEYSSSMNYNVEKKILEISGSAHELLGNWWKIEENKNQLILQRNSDDPLNTCTLDIKKL